MSVAVVIPTYNRAQLLERAINSVLKQTRPADRIIIVDDGSTDNTSQVIQKNFPQLTLIRTDHRGVSHARNCGIQAANSDWIALLDSDDEWMPGKLATQLNALQSDPVFKVCHSDEKWIRNGRHLNQKKKHRKHGGWIFKNCLPLCAVSPSAAVIHHSVFDDIGLFDETLPACEDYDLWLRITAKYPVLFVPQVLLIKYGGHEDQLSQKHWGMDRFRIQALEKAVNLGQLRSEYETAALHMLLDKLVVLIDGAKKHQNEEVLRCYSMKLKYYQQRVDHSGQKQA